MAVKKINNDAIVDKMIEVLSEVEDGSVTTTSHLADYLGYGDIDHDDLFDIHFKLFEAAEKNGIILDMSAHEDKLEGLPYVLNFVI